MTALHSFLFAAPQRNIALRPQAFVSIISVLSSPHEPPPDLR
jgi:hypothetical protein